LQFKPGDRVAGTFRTGAFAEYASYPELSTFHIPGTLTFEEACTIPLGLTTAAMGIYRRLGYPLDKPITERKTIVVWGASGSVGQYAVQLAKLVGLRVIGVAGAGAPVAKISGCDVVVDYRQGQTLAQIKQALDDEQLQHGFDAVSEPPTTSQLASLIAPSTKDAKVVMVLYPHEPLPTHIQYLQTSVFSIYGEEVRHGANVVPAMPEDTEFAKRFFPALEGWLREGGKIIPNKITIVEGGLEGVREGFRRMREKEVSGEKLVFRIAETPGVEAH
jgi:NADPH:quinone reductase-like Zn-dependent oxidoreductase